MFVLVLTLLATAAAANEYCSKSCGNTPHTLCKNNADVLHSRCRETREKNLQRAVTEDEKKFIVDKHNELRRKIARGQDDVSNMPSAANMMELEWDDELAYIAQGWANQCYYEHDSCRKTKDGCFDYVGQNLAVQGDSRVNGQPTNWDWAIQAWYDEIKDYYPQNAEKFTSPGRNGGVVGHFTQLIWADTHKIGCGYVKFYGSQPLNGRYYNNYYVCNYGKGGNVSNKPVYKVGNACSQCPKNSKCQKGLCKLN